MGDEVVGEGGDGEELHGERGHAERVVVVVVDEVLHRRGVALKYGKMISWSPFELQGDTSGW